MVGVSHMTKVRLRGGMYRDERTYEKGSLLLDAAQVSSCRLILKNV